MTDSGHREPYSVWLAKVRNRADAGEPSSGLGSDESFAGAPALSGEVTGPKNALVPHIAALDDPHTPAAEQYRLLAARLEGLWKQPEFQKVAITSTLPGEGKSLTTINVASVLAKDFGRRVLVIDGDFRKPSLWRFMGAAPAVGLSDVVANRLDADSAVQPLRFQHLGVLQAGLAPINSTRLWKSQVIKNLLLHFGREYDYVIVDTPPVLTVVDTTLITDLMDGVVVVVRSGATPRAALQKALGSLPRAKLVGTVFNAAKRLQTPYYYHVR